MFNKARGCKLLNTAAITWLALIWLVCAGFGFSRLWLLENHAGQAGHPPVAWIPPAPALDPAHPTLDPARPTLVMLLHPQCPCSRASVAELNRLAALCPNQAKTVVLFLRPAGYPVTWTHTELWRQASAIPGVVVCTDDGGTLARQFGAATSGETLLYAPNGDLLYHGGLTGARGHEGDNAGLAAVVTLLNERKNLNGRTGAPASLPVYGCPLFGCAQTLRREEN